MQGLGEQREEEQFGYGGEMEFVFTSVVLSVLVSFENQATFHY